LDVPRRTGPPMKQSPLHIHGLSPSDRSQQNSRQDEHIGSMAHARPFGRPHSASPLQQTSNRLAAYTPPTVVRAAAPPRSAARFSGTERSASSICWEAGARPSRAMQVADESRWPWTGRASRPPQQCEQLELHHRQPAAAPYDMPYAHNAPSYAPYASSYATAANDRTRPSSRMGMHEDAYGYARGWAMGHGPGGGGRGHGGLAHQIRPSSGFLGGGAPGPWPR